MDKANLQINKSFSLNYLANLGLNIDHLTGGYFYSNIKDPKIYLKNNSLIIRDSSSAILKCICARKFCETINNTENKLNMVLYGVN